MEKHIIYTTIDGYEYDNELEAKMHEEIYLKNQAYLKIHGNKKNIVREDVLAYFKALKCVFCPLKEECDKNTFYKFTCVL